MKYKNFIYFPSFDTGVSEYALKNYLALPDGTPFRFWDDTYPELYRHKYFLISAGHKYKKKDYREKYNFPDDMLIMGDSGGYQIATGAIKWDVSIRETIFNWLEDNADISMNLDIPTRKKYAGKFEECLEISLGNFKYFADNQSGKTDFLNVMQGSTLDKYSNWYGYVKEFPFQGWAVGGAQGSVISLLASLVVLKENNELHKESNKWLHILGTSSVAEFLMLAEIQRVFELIDSPIQLTTDSSTPSRTCAFGFYYTKYNLKTMKFQYIHIPRKTDVDKIQFDKFRSRRLPVLNSMDDLIWKHYDLEDFLEWKTEHYAWLVTHNFSVFQDCIREINDLVNGPRYILSQCINPDMLIVLNSIEELLTSSKPREVFYKYFPIYDKLSRMSFNDHDESSNTFF